MELSDLWTLTIFFDGNNDIFVTTWSLHVFRRIFSNRTGSVMLQSPTCHCVKALMMSRRFLGRSWNGKVDIWSSENKPIPNSEGDHCVFKQKQSGTICLFPKAWFTAIHWFTLPETNIEPENRIKGYDDIWWLNKCTAGMILDNFHKHWSTKFEETKHSCITGLFWGFLNTNRI